MDAFTRDNLEDYLSGNLTNDDQQRFDALLAQNSQAAAEVASMSQVSGLFEILRVPEDELVTPTAGFYVQLMRGIEEEKKIPFWMVFFEPLMLKRLAFASLMWLALLGSVSTFRSMGESSDTRMAGGFFTESPHPEYNVRFSSDLEQNRNQMLAVMLVGD